MARNFSNKPGHCVHWFYYCYTIYLQEMEVAQALEPFYHLSCAKVNLCKQLQLNFMLYYFCKIISKLLIARLVDVVDHLLHPSQIIFVKGITIIDNIHITQELLNNYNRKGYLQYVYWMLNSKSLLILYIGISYRIFLLACSSLGHLLHGLKSVSP